MKLEKEVNILPMVISNPGGNDIYKNATIRINISELTNEEMKIIRKGQVSKLKLTLEIEESILDDEERKYLSGVIRPYKNRIMWFRKNTDNRGEYIDMSIKGEHIMSMPYFKRGTMYKGMELNKEYTLEDLQL